MLQAVQLCSYGRVGPARTHRKPRLPAPLPPRPPSPPRRRVYDQTGSVEDSEELAGEKFNELYNYYRSMFAPVGAQGPPGAPEPPKLGDMLFVAFCTAFATQPSAGWTPTYALWK